MNDLLQHLKTLLQKIHNKAEEHKKEVELVSYSSLFFAVGFLACYLLIPLFISRYHNMNEKKNMIEEQVLTSALVKREAGNISTTSSTVLISYLDPVTKTFVPVYEKDAATAHLSASLIKIPTALAVLSKTPLDTLVTITQQEEKIEGSGFKIGSTLSVRDIVSSMMVASSNDSVEALSNLYKREGKSLLDEVKNYLAMNRVTDVAMGSLSGLDNDGVDSFITPSSVLVLANHLVDSYPWLARSTTLPTYSSEKTGERLDNTNPIVSKIPGLLFSKTGFTKKAGGNLVVLFNACGKRWGIVVMGDTFTGRFESINSYVKTVMDSCSFADNLQSMQD